MVKLLLEMFDVPYVPVASLSMQERVRLIERVLRLAGMRPSEPGVLRPLSRELEERPQGPRLGNGSGNGHGRSPSPTRAER